MPTTSSKTLTIRVGPKLRLLIEQYAAANEMSAGEFVRYCVRVYTDTVPLDGEIPVDDE